MTPDALADELREGRIRPAYLLAGEEALLRDDALAALRALVEPAARDFNLDLLRAADATPKQLGDAVSLLPIMAPRRVVILRDLEERSAAGRALAECLAGLVASLPDDGSAVLVVSASRIDGRGKLARLFRDPAATIECEPPKPRALPAFVRTEAARQGVRLESGVAEMLAEQIGGQLLLIRNEIAKVALLAGEGAAVGRAHVAQATRDVAPEPIWDLTDAIGEGRTGEALGLLGKLLGSGAAPVMLLGSLAGHFRRLIRVRMGGRVAGPPFVVRKLEQQAQRYSPGRLRGCLVAIHEVDEALKGKGGLPPELALQRLVLGLAG